MQLEKLLVNVTKAAIEALECALKTYNVNSLSIIYQIDILTS